MDFYAETLHSTRNDKQRTKNAEINFEKNSSFLYGKRQGFEVLPRSPENFFVEMA